jgi:ankyrin repeat protein
MMKGSKRGLSDITNRAVSGDIYLAARHEFNKLAKSGNGLILSPTPMQDWIKTAWKPDESSNQILSDYLVVNRSLGMLSDCGLEEDEIQGICQKAGASLVSKLEEEKSGVPAGRGERFDPNIAVNENGDTLLMIAAEQGGVEMAQVLLEHPGVKVNKTNRKRKTALLLAIDSGCEEICEALINDPRTSVAGEVGDDNTPLILATMRRMTGVVRTLLQRPGIKPNTKDGGGLVALVLAAGLGCADIVDMLLKHDETDLNVQDDEGNTALNLAVKHHYRGIVDLIVERMGDSINTVDEDGDSVLVQAIKNGENYIVAGLLTSPYLNVNATNEHGTTALHVAIECQNTVAVKCLLNKKNIDLNIPQHGSQMAEGLAFAVGNKEIAGLVYRASHPEFSSDAEVHSDANIGGAAKNGSAAAEPDSEVAESADKKPIPFDDNWHLTGSLFNNPNHRHFELQDGYESDESDDSDDLYSDVAYIEEEPANADELGVIESGDESLGDESSADPVADWIDAGEAPDEYDRVYDGTADEEVLTHEQEAADEVGSEEDGEYMDASLEDGGETSPEQATEAEAVPQEADIKNTFATAASANDREAVAALLENPQVNPNMALAPNGTTVLMVAVMYGASDVVDALLKHPNIDVNVSNESGQTALLWAVRQSEEAIFNMLIEDGRVLVSGNEGDTSTPLIEAVERGETGFIDVLLAKEGMNPNIKNSSGETALSIARVSGNTEIIDMLLAHPEIGHGRQDDEARDSSSQNPEQPHVGSSSRNAATFYREGQGSEDDTCTSGSGSDLSASDDSAWDEYSKPLSPSAKRLLKDLGLESDDDLYRDKEPDPDPDPKTPSSS